MSKAKVGDEISWRFANNPNKYPEHLCGKTFTGVVEFENEEGYHVYCEYGQDIISESRAKLTNKEQASKQKI